MQYLLLLFSFFLRSYKLFSFFIMTAFNKLFRFLGFFYLSLVILLHFFVCLTLMWIYSSSSINRAYTFVFVSLHMINWTGARTCLFCVLMLIHVCQWIQFFSRIWFNLLINCSRTFLFCMHTEKLGIIWKSILFISHAHILFAGERWARTAFGWRWWYGRPLLVQKVGWCITCEWLRCR